MSTTDERETHPVDAAVGFVLAILGIAAGAVVLYVLTAFVILSTTDW